MNKTPDIAGTSGADAKRTHDNTADSATNSAAPEDDDNALESIGKAIAAPVTGAAEPEEPTDDKPPRAPGG